MSFKSVAEAGHDGKSKYVLSGMKGMNCDVTAFLSSDLFAATNEDVWADAVRSAQFPGAKGVYLMPDCHKGYVLPVGGVLVTDETIVQAGSGYDISCGCVQLRIPGMHASDLADQDIRRRWVNAVERRVATGNHSEMPSDMAKTTGRLIQEVVRYGAKALGVSESLCERQYIPIPDDYDHKIKEAWNNATAQLGSVGGGNHFIELQVDGADGSVWIMVHCGSRAFGWKTADHFFKAGAALRGIQNNRREESYLFRDEPMGKDYWNAHNCAANYAIANRHRIVAGVNAATLEVFGRSVETYYEISHNLVQEETLVLPDGTETRGFVHRKGATRAFPAGHPELRGTKWAETGHPCLIPGSMLAGAAILFPLEGAYQSGCSVNHGSGRLLGRGEAKRELAVVQGDIDDEMNGIKRILGGVEVVGIVGNCDKTPLDECGHVYKDLDAVLAVLVDNNIARIERRLYPVANLKGTE